MRMVVTATKANVYGKSLNSGDEFDCPEKEAKLWAALMFAKPVKDETEGDIEDLRSKYRTMSGRDPDMRWGYQRLRRETSGPGTYGRRDMRAED